MKLKSKYDIIVVGAGIAGISAAYKAADMGKSVLLVEHYSILGGTSTAGMVSPFMKHSVNDIPLVRGTFELLEKEMIKQGGMIDNGFYSWAFRSAAMKLLDDVNVDVAFNSDVTGVKKENGYIKLVDLKSNNEKYTVEANYFIDSSGDAQLVDLADFGWSKGDEKNQKLQALTLFFRMGGIDVERTAEYTKKHQENFLPWMDFEYDYEHIISIAGYTNFVKDAQSEGKMSKDIEYVFFTTLPSLGEGSFNCTNILNLDASKSIDLSLAEQEGYKQVHQIVDMLIENVPGFENAFLIETGSQTGVRETRRAIGDYLINGDDILKGSKFDDAIARACYGIDIHGAEGEESRMEELDEGEWYEIPLRSLIVKDAENLLVAGRCLSSTREGQSAIRIMPTSSATGEAAGAAAALALDNKVAIREIEYEKLKQKIAYNLG